MSAANNKARRNIRSPGASWFFLLVMVLALCLSSCTSYHYYFTPRFDGEMINGLVNISAWQDRILTGEDLGNIKIDSGGSIWGVTVYYWPSCRKPREVDIRVDSVFIDMGNGTAPKALDRPRWRRYQGHDWTALKISPIVLPEKEYPDYSLSFNMDVYERRTGDLIDHRSFRLRMNHVQ